MSRHLTADRGLFPNAAAGSQVIDGDVIVGGAAVVISFIILSWVNIRLLGSSHRLTLDLWLAKDNRFLNPKSSYERILTAPPCRLIHDHSSVLTLSLFFWTD